MNPHLMFFLFFLSLIIFISGVMGIEAGIHACTTLSSELGALVVQTPSSLGFEASVGAPLNLVNDELRPACVVIPRNTSQVSTAMKAIYQSKSPYAVLAGGHSAMKGWNAYASFSVHVKGVKILKYIPSVAGGVLISFSNITEAAYDRKKDTITLQPGIRWGEAVTTLAPFGVAPVSGRAA